MREVKRGDPRPLFVRPTVLIGEVHSRDAWSGTKYCIYIYFSKPNSRMHWCTHFVPTCSKIFMHCSIIVI